MVQGLLNHIKVKGLYFKVWPNKKNPLEILSIWVQAPGLDPGLGEMFRFVGPTLGNRALFVKIDLPPSQICKEFPWACNTAWGSGP